MTSRLTALAVLDRLIDSFIPPAIAADREARQRARMFLISHLLGPFIGSVVPLALFVLDPSPGLDVAVLAVSIVSFWIFPFVLKATGRYTTLCFVSIQNLLFCILWSCYFNGGVQSPTLAWVLTIPLLSFFYLGPAKKLRGYVLGQFAANFLVFALLWLWRAPKPTAPAAALEGLGLVSTTAAAIYVAMMAIYYAKILASGVELEGETRRHLATAAALRDATAEAERAGAAKAEFLAKMSHELRTPLTAVIGYSQMLLADARAEGDEDSSEDLDRIHGAGQHLLRLVNDILDLSKAEAGRMELVCEPLDVTGLLQTIVESFGVEARNGNTLALAPAGPLGVIVADGQRVQQVLTHVVENGLKFTRDGSVRIEAERRRTAGEEALVLRVIDTGIGIAPEALEAMFESFSVADDSSASKYGGAGLGLALSRKLCRLMGGRIEMSSRVGEGACVTLTLPVSPPRADADAPEAPPAAGAAFSPPAPRLAA